LISAAEPPAKQNVDVTLAMNFWEAIPSAYIENEVIALPDGVFFMGLLEFGGRLFVRPCYDEYFDLFRAGLATGTRNFVFTGTPGIGKSHFALYCLWRLATDKPLAFETIYYQYGDRVHVFRTSSSVEVINATELPVITKAFSKHFLFFDVKEKRAPQLFNGITVMFASPQPSRTQEFLKSPRSVNLFMPLWSLEELLRMRETMFPNVTVEKVAEQFNMYGGVPRFVLEKAGEGDLTLTTALDATVDFGALLRAIGNGAGSESEVHSTLVHLVPVPGDYRRTVLHWASEWVVEGVLKRYHQAVLANLREMVLFSESLSPAATLRGWLFEAYAHEQLANAKVPVLHLLPLTADQAVAFPHFTVPKPRVFPNGTSLSTLAAGVYHRPAKRNLESVDGFAKVGTTLYLFQMTVAQSHPVKGQGLLDIINTFGQDCTQTHLVFVLPDCNSPLTKFNSPQKLLTLAKTEFLALPPKLRDDVFQQWVCTVPL
jgi:hypothetical protein